VFPDVPINAGCFAPLHVPDPDGTFLYAKYPRPVNGCSAEVTQRVIEACFLALAQAIPERLWGAPAGTSGNFTLGGYDPEHDRRFIMYVFSGGGYGGSFAGDGLTNGCSAIGISKIQPVEVCEQRYPVLFEEYALRENSAGAGRHRGGFGVSYCTRLLRGEAVASFMMDHGRFGPPGILGGVPGAPNEIVVARSGDEYRPAHWSKDEDLALRPGDWVQVRTPGGGGYGDPRERDPELVYRDVRRGYLDGDAARRQYGVESVAAETGGLARLHAPPSLDT
jgi:N-methylhydantoinase B